MKSIGFHVAVLLALTLALAGCKKEDTSHSGKPPEAGHEGHGQGEGAGHHDGKPLELGSGNAGPFAIRAARDEGAIKPGGDAPIDVWVTSGPRVSAVRFWIGLEDARGSIKALAAIEDPAQPNHWHTHAEVPDPLPAGSKLWVEIEGEGGAKGTASFDLKM
jgi:hypothetical protein